MLTTSIIRDTLYLSVQDATFLSMLLGYTSSVIYSPITLIRFIVVTLVYEVIIYIAYKAIKRHYDIKTRIIYNVFYIAGYILGLTLMVSKGTNFTS